MAGDNNSRKSTPGTTSGTIKLKKTKSKLDPAASRANSPASSVIGDSITVKPRVFSPDTSTASAPAIDETNKLCKHCKKHYDATVEPNHSRLCLRAKQERQRKKREEKERAERAAAGEDVNMEDSTAGTPLRGASVVSTAAPKVDTPDTKPKKATTSAAASGTDKKQTKKRKATDTDTASAGGDPSEKGSMKPPTKKQKKAAAFAAAAERRAESASLRGTPAPGLAAAKATAAKEKAPVDPLALTTTNTNTSTTSAKEKASAAKAKAPVDVERQCGVPLPNGQLCARSLTCKSHAMGAKRAVPGRSLPYDILLNQYQKKNQAKLQKAVMERNAAEEREREGLEGGDGEGGRVDSEEEVERVLGGLGRWNPKPVVEWGAGTAAGGGAGVWGGVQRRTREVRFKEMLGDALKGTRGSSLFGVAPRVPEGAGVLDGADGAMSMNTGMGMPPAQQGMMGTEAIMGPPQTTMMMGNMEAEAARRMSVQAAHNQARRASQQAQLANMQALQSGAPTPALQPGQAQQIALPVT